MFKLTPPAAGPTPAQVEWTIASILAPGAYAALLWFVWRHHHITPAAYAARETVAPTTSAVNAHTMPDELLLVPAIIHKGQYPLYDVAVRFG